MDTKSNNKKTSKPGGAAKNKWNGSPRPIGGSNFKWAISELTGYVFVTGPNQANKYDDVYEYLLHYLGNKFVHRVYRAFECKDHMVGLS